MAEENDSPPTVHDEAAAEIRKTREQFVHAVEVIVITAIIAVVAFLLISDELEHRCKRDSGEWKGGITMECDR
jgi:hypothetical protein